MLLKYYLPERDFTWQELDAISAKVDGLWTWPTAAMLWLAENGFIVRSVEAFSYEDFIRDGRQYLLDYFGQKVGQEQIDHSDIDQEIIIAQSFVQKLQTERRIPEISDLEQCLDSGQLLCCNVNSRVLKNKEGYSGHFILVIGYDKDTLIIHDPGPSPSQDWVVPKELFARAWAYPDNRAKTFFTISPV